MSRADWVSRTLTPEQLAALTEELVKVFAGFKRYHGREVSREQVEAFAAAISEALDGYEKLLKPTAGELQKYESELQALVKAASAVINTVERLSDVTPDRLEMAQWAALQRPPRTPEFKTTQQAARWLKVTAAAQTELRKIRDSRKAGPQQDRALTSVIRELAEIYGKVFGVPASWSDKGLFMQALQATSLPVISENRLRGMIDRGLH
jgi:Skp family chaperone for outer membrane proteins